MEENNIIEIEVNKGIEFIEEIVIAKVENKEEDENADL